VLQKIIKLQLETQQLMSKRKNILTACFILFLSISLSCYSQDLLKEVEVNKLKSTLSLKVNEIESIHFLIWKNKGELKFSPYLISDSVKELKSFTLNRNSIILSKHIYKDKIVFLYKQSYWMDTKELFHHYLIEYSYVTEKVSKPILLRNFQSEIITANNATFFIKKDEKSFTIHRVESLEENDFFYYSLNEEELNNINTNLDYINLNNYPFGSVQSQSFYYFENSVIITSENLEDKLTHVFKFDLSKSLNEKNYSLSNFKNKLEKNKILKSFLVDDKLFQFAIDKGFKTAELNIFDFDTQEILKTFQYSNESFQPYNKCFHGREEIDPEKTNFLRNYRNLISPFITVEENQEYGYEVNIGSLPIISNYYALTDATDHGFQSSTVYIEQQIGTSFYFREQLLDNSKNNNHSHIKHFSLLLDNKLDKHDSESKSMLDKIKHLDKIDKARERNVKKNDKKYRSYISLKNKFRFIEYDSSENTVYVYEY